MSERQFTTPIDTFGHPSTGSVVDVVALLHVGEQQYYRTLGRHIMGRQDEGFIVQYEKISFNPDAPLTDPSRLTRLKDKIDDISTDAAAKISVTLDRTTSWVDQDERQLFYPEGAENIDLDHSDILPKQSLFSKLYQLLSYKTAYRKVARMAEKDPAALDQFVFQKLKKVSDRYQGGNRRRKSPLIIDKRNEVALTGVDSALEADASARIVLVWGLAHLAGLSSGLIERGYEQTGRKDIVVATDTKGLDEDMQKTRKEIVRLQAKVTKSNAKARRSHVRARRR